MWGRQLSSPRRNYQSLSPSGCSTSLPKLFLHPSVNPNFSGTQFANTSPISVRRSFQFSSSTPSSPNIRSPMSSSKEQNSIPIDLSQQNYKFPLPNKDICLNRHKSKNGNELSFEGGKPYTSSYIFHNYRHFLTPIEENEIKKYTEIFYLRRKPKKKRRSLKNKNDDSSTSANEMVYFENNSFSEANDRNYNSTTASFNSLDENNKDGENEIYDTIKSKINKDLNDDVILNEIPKSNFDNKDRNNDEFNIGDHVAYRYEVLSKIGTGAFGTVLKCYDHKMSCEVALKMIKETHESHPEIALEAKFLEALQNGCEHHHIVKLYESFIFRNYFCISMEFISSVYEISEERIRCRFSNSDLLQLFDAINFIHSNGILHCDLKPSNILFEIDDKSHKANKQTNVSIRSKDTFHEISQVITTSHKNRRSLSLNKYNDNSDDTNNRYNIFQSNKKILKIIDFGCSCYIGQCPYEKIQSLNYRAPEVVLRLMPYTTSIDIWSIGCIAYETAVGAPLFNSNSERELIGEIVELIGQPPLWMVEESPRSSKFFTESDGVIKINPNTTKCKNCIDNDDLIKNGHDKKILSPIHSTQSNNSSLIKNCRDFTCKSLNPNEKIEANFKVCSPTSKNTTVRKNKIVKKNENFSVLRARISGVGGPHLLSLLEGCIAWDPHERLSAEQLLNHPWSKNVK